MNKDEFITELADLLSVDESELTSDVVLEKLEDWDSLAVIGFIALLDKKLGKKIGAGTLFECKTFGDLERVAGF
jgi:acyl carrier protein